MTKLQVVLEGYGTSPIGLHTGHKGLNLSMEKVLTIAFFTGGNWLSVSTIIIALLGVIDLQFCCCCIACSIWHSGQYLVGESLKLTFLWIIELGLEGEEDLLSSDLSNASCKSAFSGKETWHECSQQAKSVFVFVYIQLESSLFSSIINRLFMFIKPYT